MSSGTSRSTTTRLLRPTSATAFRDRLTELACIAWVEDVAREVYGKGDHVKLSLPDGAFWSAHVYIGTPRSFGSLARHEIDRDTLAEACIAAVRAMKGGE